MLAALLGFSWLAIDSKQLALWAFAALVGAMFALIVDRTGARKWPGALAIAVFFTAWVTAHWVVVMSTTATYPDQLTVPHLFATAVAMVRRGAATEFSDDGADRVVADRPCRHGRSGGDCVPGCAQRARLRRGGDAAPVLPARRAGRRPPARCRRPGRLVGAGAGRGGRVVGVQRDLARRPFRGRHRLRRPRRLHRDVSAVPRLAASPPRGGSRRGGNRNRPHGSPQRSSGPRRSRSTTTRGATSSAPRSSASCR